MRRIHATCGELNVLCAVSAVVEERHNQVHLVPDRGVEVRQPAEHETAITARQQYGPVRSRNSRADRSARAQADSGEIQCVDKRVWVWCVQMTDGGDDEPSRVKHKRAVCRNDLVDVLHRSADINAPGRRYLACWSLRCAGITFRQL